MSYQWGQMGPAFEYPSCWRTENRFLTLRAAVLSVLALVVFWLALAEPDAAGGSVSNLIALKQRGDATPHVLMACLLIALAGWDLWVAARQRRLFLAPGQPASLSSELVRQARGTGPGAAWLAQVLASGKVPPAELRGPYRRLLGWLAPHLVRAPSSLQGYLSERLAHLFFGLGLALLMALTWLLLRQPPALALVALLYAGVAAGMVARSAWIAKAAPSPLAVAVALLLAAVAGLSLGWFAAQVPQVSKLVQLGLPVAVAVLLACLLLIEGLGLLAGRVATDQPAGEAPALADVRADIASEPDRLMQEVERELHRYWSEGIPNRRHAWQTLIGDEKAAEGKAAARADTHRFSASVLEETQPLLAADHREGIPQPRGARLFWLLLLNVLGLLLTLAGGLLWVRLTHAHMQDAAASLAPAAPALVLLVAGGYALRIGHFLWSRIEVDSSLLSLESQSIAPAGGPAQQRLRWSVVKVRSVFYAAGEHSIGSRTLLHLTADEASARRSVLQVQAYAQRPLAEERAPAPAPAARPLPPTPMAGSPRPARFCSTCGTPLLAGARFCQNCGTVL